MTFFEKAEITDANCTRKSQTKRFFFFLICSFAILMLCSKCSFLYRFNDWCDMNWFHTMGRGMFSGLVPYRDLYEQKGPVLFFIIGLVSLFSETSTIGVWLLEVFTFTLYQHFSHKIIRRYLPDPAATVATVAVAILTATTWAFNQGGGSVEEYCLPLFAYGMYKFLLYFEDGKTLTFREMLLIGISVGLIFWSKYLTALYFAIIMLLWMWDMLAHRRNVRGFFVGFLGGLLGVLLITLPVLLYFAVNGAVADLVQVYFVDNLTLYSDPVTEVAPIVKYIGLYAANFILDGIAIFGLLCYYREASQKGRLRPAVNLLLFYGIQFVEVLCIGYYAYYHLIFAPFAGVTVIPAAKLLIGGVTKRKECGKRVPGKRAAAMLLACFSLLFCLFAGNSTRDLGREDYPQIEVAEYIEEHSDGDATLLCYKMLDYGFYRAAGITPTTRFFALNNYSRETYPLMYEEYESYAKEGEVDFIVVHTEDYLEEKDSTFALYEPVAEYEYEMHDNNYVTYSYEFTLLMLDEQ